MFDNKGAWLLFWLFIAFLMLTVSGFANPYDYPFRGKTYIHYMSPTNIASWCGRPARGCSMSSARGTKDATCYIYINSAYLSSKAWIACIKKHENRHCNGYRGEEPC